MKFRKFLIFFILFLFIFSMCCTKKEPVAVLKEETSIEEKTTEEKTKEEIPQWKEIYDEAVRLYEEGDFGEAKKLFRKVLEMDPDNKIAKELLEKANDFIMQAIEHFNNATKLFYEKKTDEAIKELKKAIEIYPKYKEALDILEELGLLEELNLEK